MPPLTKNVTFGKRHLYGRLFLSLRCLLILRMRWLRKWSRGLLSLCALVVRFRFLLLAGALWLSAVLGQHEVYRCSIGSRQSNTRMDINQLVQEAYPYWSMDTGKACPNGLSELDEYRNTSSTKDAWGRELVMLCGDDAPPSIFEFAVLSAGQDGRFGTRDDIKSWDPSH